MRGVGHKHGCVGTPVERSGSARETVPWRYLYPHPFDADLTIVELERGPGIIESNSTDAP